MLFILFFAAMVQASFFQPSKAYVQRCFDLTSDQDPNFFECLQSLVCKVPIPTMSSYNTTTPVATPTPSPTAQESCVPCDCSDLDKNSDQYFNCITDPKCDRCTNTPSPLPSSSSWWWSNTSMPITTPPSTTTSSSTYETMVPGTYTFVSNGTTRVMVVPTSAPRNSSTARVVTVTLTTVVTVPAKSATKTTTKTTTQSNTESKSTSSATQRACPKFCDCTKIKDKSSDEYFQCLTNPACEHCLATATATATTASSTSESASDSGSATADVDSVRASHKPCSDECDCDAIKDPQSVQYMACVENPDCKHCVKRRWFRRFWAKDY